MRWNNLFYHIYRKEASVCVSMNFYELGPHIWTRSDEIPKVVVGRTNEFPLYERQLYARIVCLAIYSDKRSCIVESLSYSWELWFELNALQCTSKEHKDRRYVGSVGRASKMSLYAYTERLIWIFRNYLLRYLELFQSLGRYILEIRDLI